MEMNGAFALLGLVVVCLTSPHQTGAVDLLPTIPVPRLRLFSAKELHERSIAFRHRHEIHNRPIKVIMVMIHGLDSLSELPTDLFDYVSFPVQVDFKVCREKNCNCAAQLTSQLSSLLSWARIKKGMSTSAFYETPTNYPEYAETSRTDTRVTQQGRKPRNSELYNILAYALDDLTMSNAHGHLVIVNLDVGKLSYVLAMLRRHESGPNTLVVVTSSCPRNVSQNTRLFARGPGAEHLAAVEALPQVPEFLRFAIDTCIHCNNAELASFDIDVPRPRFTRNDTVTSWGHEETGSVTTTVVGTAIAFAASYALTV